MFWFLRNRDSLSKLGNKLNLSLENNYNYISLDFIRKQLSYKKYIGYSNLKEKKTQPPQFSDLLYEFWTITISRT